MGTKESTGELYVATSGTEAHTFIEADAESARHWVINHLDCSKEWEVRKYKPMRILITGTATRDLIRKKPAHAGHTQYEMDFHSMMSAIQGKWIEVETDFCFENQFNTAPIEGVSKNGMRIMAESVADIDFGDLGEEGWKNLVRKYQKEGWNNDDVRFIEVNRVLHKAGKRKMNPHREVEWERGYTNIGESIDKTSQTKEDYCG